MEYDDFSIRIESKCIDEAGNEYYPVRVLRSPQGEGGAKFYLPVDLDKVHTVLSDMGNMVRRGPTSTSYRAPSDPTRDLLTDIGAKLFDALFVGTVARLWHRSVATLDQYRGLRIKLRFDPNDDDIARLASLPWEFMYDIQDREYLNLMENTPIVRYLEVARPPTPLAFKPPLRILVAIANPSDHEKINVDHERTLIEKNWAKHQNVDVEFLSKATFSKLRERLRTKNYHVLHFMGHGSFDESTGKGALVFEGDDGCGRQRSGESLGDVLKRSDSLRLVFLNACNTATVTKKRGLDPFAGVASALVLAGIPAVVAMLFPISDDAAIKFSRGFYQSLAGGNSVDTAVAMGRQEIYHALSTMEWGTPVLFMRAPDGVLFQVAKHQSPAVSGTHTMTTKEAERPAQPPGDDKPSALPHRSRQLQSPDDEQYKEDLWRKGVVAYHKRDWKTAYNSFQAIMEIDPNYEDAAAKFQESEQMLRRETLFDQVNTFRESAQWQDAIELLEEHLTIEPSDADATTLLAQCKKQKQLALLYDEVSILTAVEEWEAVMEVCQRIAAIESKYRDVDELLQTATEKLAAAQRQELSADLLGRSLEAMEAQNWQQARELLSQLREVEPEHPDVQQLMARAAEEIERAKDEQKRQDQAAEDHDHAQKHDCTLDQAPETTKAAHPPLPDAKQFTFLMALEGHKKPVSAVAFSPNGSLLASGSHDKTVRIWSLPHGKILHRLTEFDRQVNSLAFSPDSAMLATGSGGFWSAGDESLRLLVWNATKGQLVRPFFGHTDSVLAVAYSADGRLLASASKDKSIRLWNPLDGSLLNVLQGHSSDVRSVSFSPDSTMLASCASVFDNTVRIWSLSDGSSLFTMKRGNVQRVTFSPDGTMLASSHSSEICVWNPQDGSLIREMKLPLFSGLKPLISGALCLVISPDGSLLAAGCSDNTVRIWNPHDGTLLQTIEGHTDAVFDVAFSPDGTLLASGSKDTTIRLWTLK